jgi:ATP-dependent DNA helicase RecG
MVREAVINALIHRDYDIRQGKCQLVVTADTIIVKSPGGPLPPVTLDQLRSFNPPMLSRNPELHYVLGRMGMVEERGLGVKSLKNRAEELGLPLPRYDWEDPYLVLTLFRNPEAVVETLKPAVLKSLTDSERKGWQWLATKGTAKSGQYAKALQMDDRTARRHFNRFLELGLVKKRGSGPSIEYEVL